MKNDDIIVGSLVGIQGRDGVNVIGYDAKFNPFTKLYHSFDNFVVIEITNIIAGLVLETSIQRYSIANGGCWITNRDHCVVLIGDKRIIAVHNSFLTKINK